MVELRKRKTPPPPAPTSKKAAPAKKRATSKSATSTPAPAAATPAEEPQSEKPTDAPASSSKNTGGPPKVGDVLPLEELKSVTIQTNNGEDATLPALLEKSPDKSIAIFTYPKASTPGCTKQACLFRDTYDELTPVFEVYGLSNDFPKSNTTFKEKQKLPYTLLCDPKKALLSKLGFSKAGGSATRGVIVVDKAGKVTAWTTGGPQPTLDAVTAVMTKGEQK